jgi:hypothetical protein
VDLTLGRHVEYDVAQDLCCAPKAAAGVENPAPVVLVLRGSWRREVLGCRGQRVLRELAEGRPHLAPAADAAAAAHRVEVDAEPAGCVEHGRARRHASSLTGRHEDDDGIGRGRSGHDGGGPLGSQPPAAINERSRSGGKAASSRAASVRAASSGSLSIGKERRRHSAT